MKVSNCNSLFNFNNILTLNILINFQRNDKDRGTILYRRWGKLNLAQEYEVGKPFHIKHFTNILRAGIHKKPKPPETSLHCLIQKPYSLIKCLNFRRSLSQRKNLLRYIRQTYPGFAAVLTYYPCLTEAIGRLNNVLNMH